MINCTGETHFYQIRSNNLGWTCPNCGKVFSPTVTECPYCNNGSSITISDNSDITFHNIENFKNDKGDINYESNCKIK